MKKIPLVMVVLLGLIGLATAAISGPKRSEVCGQAPSGSLICLRTNYNPNCSAIQLLPGGTGFKYICDRQMSRAWFVFDGHMDSVLVWPRNQTVAITTQDGRVLEASEILCVTPRESHPGAEPIFLNRASFNLRIPVDQVFQKLSRDGSPAVQIFVGFSDPMLGLRDITEVQIRPKDQQFSGAASTR